MSVTLAPASVRPCERILSPWSDLKIYTFLPFTFPDSDSTIPLDEYSDGISETCMLRLERAPALTGPIAIIFVSEISFIKSSCDMKSEEREIIASAPFVLVIIK